MNQMWYFEDMDECLRVQKITKEVVEQYEKDLGRPLIKEECELIFNAVCKELDIKNLGATELSKDEMIIEAIKKGHKGILDVGADGKIRIIKKKEE